MHENLTKRSKNLTKEEVIQALLLDSFELDLTIEDDGKSLQQCFREHAIKVVKAL